VLKKLFDKSLRLKIFGMGFVIVFVSTMSSALIIGQHEVEQWDSFLHDKAQSLASYTADISQEEILEKDSLHLDNIVKKINKDPDIISAVVYDNRGKLLTSFFASLNLRSPVVENVLAQAPANIDLVGILNLIRQDVPGYELSAPVRMGQESLGHVVITLSEEKAHQGVRRIINCIILVSLFSMLIAFLLFLWIQDIIIKPVLNLVMLMTNVSLKRDYSLRTDLRTNDELGLLGSGFNEMLDQIQTHREHLEDQVAQRTAQLLEVNKRMQGEIIERKCAEMEVKKAYDELKSMHSQLIQADKMASIGQLAAGVAHEINNPVGFISSNVDILQGYIQNYARIFCIIEKVKAHVDEGDTAKVKTAIDELRKLEKEIDLDYMMNDVNILLQHSSRGLERIRKIVLDLRTFAREDKMDHLELFKIEEVIDGVLSIVQNELKYKAELVKEYETTPMVKGNTQRVGQVFINLLVNAAQAIEVRGNIMIKTYLKDKYVCVDIIDTGKGIPEENLKKIFDPFFTTKPVGQGTGLGLSVSYEIIKRYEGRIEVASKLGKGTTFTVMLPTFQ